MGRQPRQRPISCQFCRMRKLRCSRIFPCSNCTSRGVTCVQMAGPSGRSMSQVKELPQSAHASPVEAQASSSITAPVTTAIPTPADQTLQNSGFASEMMLRMEKLEALVASQNALLEETRKSGGQSQGCYSEVQRQKDILPPITTTSSTCIPPKLQGLTDDALWLEMISSGNMLKVRPSYYLPLLLQ